MFALSSRWAACSPRRLTPTGVAQPLAKTATIANASVHPLIDFVNDSQKFATSPAVAIFFSADVHSRAMRARPGFCCGRLIEGMVPRGFGLRKAESFSPEQTWLFTVSGLLMRAAILELGVQPRWSLDALLCDSIATVFIFFDLCGRRRYGDRYLFDRSGEFVVAFFVVLGHRGRQVFADVLGVIG